MIPFKSFIFLVYSYSPFLKEFLSCLFVYAIQRSLVFVVNMSFISQLYNTLFRRTSTFALTIITSAFIFERVIDEGGDYVFNRINQGKLWHQIKHNYTQNDEGEDD